MIKIKKIIDKNKHSLVLLTTTGEQFHVDLYPLIAESAKIEKSP